MSMMKVLAGISMYKDRLLQSDIELFVFNLS